MNIIPLVLWALLGGTTIGITLSGISRRREEIEGLQVSRYSYRWPRALRALLVGAVGTVVLSTLAFIPAGHRGVIFSQSGGVQATERFEGISFLVPFFQQVYAMDVRTKVYTYEATTKTSDLQEVKIPVSINYHIDPARAAEVYQDVGPLELVAPVVLEPPVFLGLNTAVGKVIASNLAQETETVAEAVLTAVLPVAARHGIVIEFASINDKVFDPAFLVAVKNKVIEGQKVEQSALTVEVATNEAEAVVERATGDATAIETIAGAQAAANDLINATLTADLLTWQRIAKWNGTLPTTLVGGPTDILLAID